MNDDSSEHLGEAKKIECPRCGYDVSGVAAQWKETCELHGQCSECGLSFAWADVVRPDRQLPRWLFDYSAGAFDSWVRAWKTFWCACIPNVFFNRVELWHAPVARKAAWWLPLLLLSAWAVSSLFGCVSVWFELQNLANGKSVWTSVLNSYVYRFDQDWVQYINVLTSPVGEFDPVFGPPPRYQPLDWEWNFRTLPPGGLVVGVSCVAWPLALFLMRPTRRFARVKNAHVFRCWVYSLGWIVAFAWVSTVWNVIAAIPAPLSNTSMGRVLQNAVDAFQYSQFVQWFYSTRNGFDDLGPGWNAAAVIFGAVVVGHQGWWWHTVIRRHWKLPQPTLTWALLGIIAWSLAILAAIGPMSYRYIFANT